MNLTLRKFRKEDALAIQKIANNPNIAKFMKDTFPHPYTKENAEWFIDFGQNETERYIRAIEVEGELSGSIGLHFSTDILRKNAEIGYWLGEKYWQKGIMHAAINEIVKQGFEKYPINRIFARVYGNNVASQKTLLKAGFKLEASFEKTIIKNGEILDELIFAIRK